VQLSVPANWYFENGISKFFLPDEITTGHPKFAGLYLSLIWKIFGKNIAVSHWALSPFVYGLVYQLFMFIKTYVARNQREAIIILAFVIIDTTFLSQLSLITFDVIHLFLLFLCLNQLLKNSIILFSLSYAALMIISLRGTMSGMGILLFYPFLKPGQNKILSLKSYLKFLPGIIIISTYLLIFYFEKDWVIHNTSSDKWPGSAEIANPNQIAYNIAIFIWRLTDFGRIGIWIFLSVILFKTKNLNTIKTNRGFRICILFAITQLVIFFPISIIYNSPPAHRYLLPVMIIANIAVIHWIYNYSRSKIFKLSLIGILLISGHFMIYPVKIAQGWDSTTAHWPYYSLRNEMLDFIEQKQINEDSISSFFPNISSSKYIELDNNPFNFKDFKYSNTEFVLYSNIFNIDDDIIDELFHSGKWNKIKVLRDRRITFILFKKKAN